VARFVNNEEAVMRGTLKICLLATALLRSRASGASRQPPDVEALLAYLDDLCLAKSSIALIEIQVTKPRSTRSLRLRAWTRGEEEVLVVIEEPAREAGTATLRVGDNLWNYLPRIARTIRVPPAMMLGSWMGTDFTNDDLVKRVRCSGDLGTVPSPDLFLSECHATKG
jgi:hypothetical protein